MGHYAHRAVVPLHDDDRKAKFAEPLFLGDQVRFSHDPAVAKEEQHVVVPGGGGKVSEGVLVFQAPEMSAMAGAFE